MSDDEQEGYMSEWVTPPSPTFSSGGPTALPSAARSVRSPLGPKLKKESDGSGVPTAIGSAPISVRSSPVPKIVNEANETGRRKSVTSSPEPKIINEATGTGIGGMLSATNSVSSSPVPKLVTEANGVGIGGRLSGANSVISSPVPKIINEANGTELGERLSAAGSVVSSPIPNTIHEENKIVVPNGPPSASGSVRSSLGPNLTKELNGSGKGLQSGPPSATGSTRSSLEQQVVRKESIGSAKGVSTALPSPSGSTRTSVGAKTTKETIGLVTGVPTALATATKSAKISQGQKVRKESIASPKVPRLPSASGSIKSSLGLDIRNEPIGSATGNPRNKIALRPGFSLMDWIRLTQSGKDLTGIGGRILEISPKELSYHKTKRDAWLALNGIVYNVTSYMDYHPGGFDELMKGAGKDATKLFNDVHRWVNYESMLKACIVGKLVQTSILPALPGFSTNNGSMIRMDSPVFSIKPAKQVIPPIATRTPTINWFQTDTTVTIGIYTRRPEITKENIIVDIQDDDCLQILVLIPEDSKDEMVFQVSYQLSGKIASDPPKVSVGSTSGKVEIVLTKVDDNFRWPSLGTPLGGNNSFSKVSELKSDRFDEYRPWTLVLSEAVTHDVHHYVLEPPKYNNLHFSVPCGHHVRFKTTVMGMELVRSYTPTLANLDLESYNRLITSPTSDDNKLHFLIKHYERGAVTSHLKSLLIGSEVLVSNHIGTFSTTKLNNISQLILVAAGTGFTPMAKLIQYFYFLHHKSLADDEGDGDDGGGGVQQEVVLLFFNKTEKDIIWKEELDHLFYGNELRNDFKVKIHHILSEDPEWPGYKGRISSKLLHEIFGEAPKTVPRLLCICGSNEFTQLAKRLFQEEFKFSSSETFLFQG